MTRQYWANMALCIVLGGLVIFAVTRAGSALTPKGLFMSEPQPSQLAEKMMKYVVLNKFLINKINNQNNMFEAEFSIQNKTAHNVKNINVVCEFVDKIKEGKYLDRETWMLAETVPANHSAKITSVSNRFVHSGAKAYECYIADFEVVKKPAFTLDRHVGGSHEKAAKDGHGASPPAGH